jgi:NTE family protein
LIPVARRGKPSHRTLGVSLGSGSARGWAHIGVLNCLQEAGIHVDAVAGSSIGAVVGGAFAAGRLRSLEERMRRLDLRAYLTLFDPVLPRGGLIAGARVRDFLRPVLPGRIQDLPIPCTVVATDVRGGRPCYLRRGPLLRAVRASYSVPGIFRPVAWGDMRLLDGGLMQPLPVAPLRDQGIDLVVAVDATRGLPSPSPAVAGPAKPSADVHASHPVARRLMELARGPVERGRELLAQNLRRNSEPTLFELLAYSLQLMEKEITQLHLKAYPADVLIRPEVGHLHMFDFQRAGEAMDAGYEAARAALPELRALLAGVDGVV